jgi:hypothetical protein
VAPILSIPEALVHPHNVERKAFSKTNKGDQMPSPAPRLSRTPGHLLSSWEVSAIYFTLSFILYKSSLNRSQKVFLRMFSQNKSISTRKFPGEHLTTRLISKYGSHYVVLENRFEHHKDFPEGHNIYN